MTRLLFALLAIVVASFTSGAAHTASATESQSHRDRREQTSVLSVSPWPNPAHLVVSPDGPYTTIAAALIDAREGDTIEVRGGAYAGPLVVDKPVRLEGAPMDGQWPVIDGGGQGTVVTLAAPGIVFRGFEVRGSGAEPDRDHAGITLSASRITVENNRLRDVLFGVFVAQADDAVIRGNDITSKAELDEGRRGDAIRIWYSQRATVERNTAYAARDVVMWYSSDSVVRDNLFERGRYGVHLMYCNRVVIERNQILNNSVGIFTMYSTDTRLRENLIRGQRGPSGFALGFKDAGNVEVIGNVLVDNRVGLFVDGTPYAQGYARYAGNILAFNDVGVVLQPSVRGNQFAGNTFWENVEQVSVQGGGVVTGNTWQGNYWSDYSGFDVDGDGLGDAPYRAERFFESLTDREPRLRALIYSPAVQALEAAAAAFPIVKPQPKLTDALPLAQPAAIPAFAVPQSNSTAGISLAALIMLGLSVACGGLAFVRRGVRPFLSRTEMTSDFAPAAAEGVPNPAAAAGFGNPWRAEVILPAKASTPEPAKASTPVLSGEAPARVLSGVQPMGNESLITVRNVGKRYGRVKALEGVSFQAGQAQAIALWGPNGAGKTTLLKAILGLIAFDGEIEVAGYSVRRAGKRARSHIGYVPQEAVFYDWRVSETMEFYARLKKVAGARIPALLEQLGLRDHARKPVSALSGGLKQRLALAVALLADPPLLLLDEP
ncbi:MAG TPA: nitrous oxide reductase family maturation protein NosD, partial [Anaerolineae bacterium]|nr:nitrous oxide reductase family maturation protein NosD [Anaerolineae bacterium]